MSHTWSNMSWSPIVTYKDTHEYGNMSIKETYIYGKRPTKVTCMYCSRWCPAHHAPHICQKRPMIETYVFEKRCIKWPIYMEQVMNRTSRTRYPPHSCKMSLVKKTYVHARDVFNDLLIWSRWWIARHELVTNHSHIKRDFQKRPMCMKRNVFKRPTYLERDI